MRTKQTYCSELKMTYNMETDKTYYYLLKCDVWVRISETEYLEREADAFRADSFLTQIKGKFLYQSKTIYIEVWSGSNEEENDHEKQLSFFK